MSVADINLELLKQELIRDEGLRLDAYQDSLGFWTIGVGHLLTSKPDGQWSKDKCLEVLDQDILQALTGVQQMSCWPSLDTDARRLALTNMRFQLGARLLTFKNSLRLIEQKRWREAGLELRNSVWYVQTPVRAERVIRMIEQG